MSEQPFDLDLILNNALNGQPRAIELRRMRQVLEARLQGLEKLADDSAGLETERLIQEIATLNKQIHALWEEEIVAGFVEDSVRYAWKVGRLDDEPT